MKPIIAFIFFLFHLFMAFTQTIDYPFNCLIPHLTIANLNKKLPEKESPFGGYDSTKGQVLARGNSPFWRNLHIWHFNEGNAQDDFIYTLFQFSEKGILTDIQFSSTSIAQINNDSGIVTMQTYFLEYGKPIIAYLKKTGWKLKNKNSIFFPFEMVKINQLLSIDIITVFDVAINPDVDRFTGFHFNFPTNHVPISNKYLHFTITFH